MHFVRNIQFYPLFVALITICSFSRTWAKDPYWQQAIQYRIDIQMDVEKDQFSGKQWMNYTNHSPDILTELNFHLYFNAFQPGSDMDIRSRTIQDPDPRIGNRISELAPEEQGFHKITILRQGNTNLSFEVNGTILKAIPAKPIKPGQSIKLYMEYQSQVPVQIRRSGRDNKEGIRYSMSQWFPKMCEYDALGWHTDPYIGREFYGVWGDFNVNITIDSSYTVAATGTLKNAASIGHGYGGVNKSKTKELTWQFEAKNVHDFAWSADPDYIHEIYRGIHGVDFHLFYQHHDTYTENWKKIGALMDDSYRWLKDNIGAYPYGHYSIAQGGDGGMEYPMLTLITGNRSLGSLYGVSMHEFLHSWYQGVLGFDESRYYWMDEGFNEFVQNKLTNHLKAIGTLPGAPDMFPYDGDFKRYYGIVEKGIEQPLSIHADHFTTNEAYSFASYTKGSIFLCQLESVIGKKALAEGMLAFYEKWKFKHPTDQDFIRVMEEISSIDLDWYLEYMVNTTEVIDFSVDTVVSQAGISNILLTRKEQMPMPLDVDVMLITGEVLSYSIPIDLMRGGKYEVNVYGQPRVNMMQWNWVNPFYVLTIPVEASQIEKITLDPEHRLADMNRDNNIWPLSPE